MGYNVINMEDVNRSGSNDILQLQIKVSNLTSKDGKKKFKATKVMMYIRCFKSQEDGKYIDLGFKNRWLDLGFTQDAFSNDCYEGCIVKNVNDLSTGLLYVNANYVDAPSSYRVTKDKDGKDVYPKVWIKGGIIGFQKYKPNQEAFTYQPSQPSQDAEIVEATGEVVDSDEDTSQYTLEEETEI